MKPTTQWMDDFNEFDSDSWSFDMGDGSQYGIPGWGNNEQQCYTNSQANYEISESSIRMKALYYQTPFQCDGGSPKQWTSVKMTTKNKKIFKPTGDETVQIMARIKVPQQHGAWAGFWMLPNPGKNVAAWCDSGEIDIMEHVNTDDEIFTNIHYRDQHSRQCTYQGKRFPLLADDWHVYEFQWSRYHLRWIVDGQLINVMPNDASLPFHSNGFYIILNLAVGGNLVGTHIDTSHPMQMEVDWLSVNTLSPSHKS